MASNKLARTNDDIQRVLANLLTQVKDPRVQQGMISVTRVGRPALFKSLAFRARHGKREGIQKGAAFGLRLAAP